jgi:hypothetical protein
MPLASSVNGSSEKLHTERHTKSEQKVMVGEGFELGIGLC